VNMSLNMAVSIQILVGMGLMVHIMTSMALGMSEGMTPAKGIMQSRVGGHVSCSI
jgi:hypothetical protein